MCKPSLLLIVLTLAGSSVVRAQGQTDPIARPRRTQPPPALAQARDRPKASRDASAEARSLYKLGVKYGNAGLFKQAVDSLEHAVKLDPDFADAYLSLGHAYYDLGRWQQAVDNIQRGLAIKPKHKDSQERLAHARAMLEREAKTREQKPADETDGRDQANGSPASLSSVAPAPPITPKISADDAGPTRIYRVGPGDVLDVRLTENPSSESTLFTITSAGLLEHPDLTAPLASSGLTLEEIRARIESDLRRKSPARTGNVSVDINEYVSHRVLVSGLVKDPGTKILKREAIPLYVVIADAQPLPEAGKVSVLRNETKESFVIDLSAQSEMNLLVRPGDVITLQPNPAQFFYVGGGVRSPGEKSFRPGLTLTQAIIAAGGLTKNAKEARLARDNGKGFLVVNRYKLKDIDLGKVADPVIRPGDRITIE